MRRYAVAAIVMMAAAAGWLAAMPAAPVRQPIAFPHAKHQTIDCAVCHRGAARAARAGIPDIQVCTKCHATAPAGSAAVWDAAVARQSIAWVQVTHVPPHVMFSHQRHTTIARLDCASCHGQMRGRTAPVGTADVRLVMTTCLSCHRHEGAAEDCAACHR
jgi:class III cytochrome C family protein/cytochrome c7-like protein